VLFRSLECYQCKTLIQEKIVSSFLFYLIDHYFTILAMCAACSNMFSPRSRFVKLFFMACVDSFANC